MCTSFLTYRAPADHMAVGRPYVCEAVRTVAPKVMTLPTPKDIKRFMSFVEVLRGEDNCWCWLGARSRGRGNKKWYGSFWFQGGTMRAHKFAYLFLGVTHSDGEHIDHTCNFSLCVNPNHLERVTRKENQDRKVTRRLDRSASSVVKST